MMSKTDSQATYCSEVEELLKLTAEVDNKSCSKLPTRRSQRLSQIYANKNKCFSLNNIRTPSTGKLYKKKKPYLKAFLKQENPQTITQDIFSTQDLREAQDSTLTDLTCNQQHVDTEIFEHSEPLDLSNKVLLNQDLRHQDSSFSTGLNSNRQRIITLNKNINNLSVTIKVPQKDVHLDLSMKSKVVAEEACLFDLKDVVPGEKLQNAPVKPLKENLKHELPSPDINTDLSTQENQQKESITSLRNNTKILYKAESTPNIQFLPNIKIYSQDFEHKHSLNKNKTLTLGEAKENLNIKQIGKQKLPNKTKIRGRPRKTSTTVKKTNSKVIKSSVENKTTNMNYLPENEPKYMQNTPQTTQESLSKSILPDVYPPHFKYQLPPEVVITRPLFPQLTMITPDNTPSYELIDSTSSSPSLPESLHGIFDTDDIKDILNIEKVSYRLYDYHVQALAVVLNVRVQYLTDILDKIVQMNSTVLKNVENAIKMPFVEDSDLFATTPEGSPSNEDVVLNSQSPSNHRIFSLTKEKLKETKF